MFTGGKNQTHSVNTRGSMMKNLPANAGAAGDTGSIPGSGRSLEKERATHSSPCLENAMDREAWKATVHGVTKSLTRLSN